MSNLNLKFRPVNWLLSVKDMAVFPGANIGALPGFCRVLLGHWVGVKVCRPGDPGCPRCQPAAGWPRGLQAIFPP